MDRQALIEYIREAAIARGIDPDIAVRVAASEGLNANPEEGWQSMVMRDGKREESYGPFQLYMGGGLGNVFQEQTGLDPRDPSTVTQQIDFALDQATNVGWSPWYGAAHVGIGEREGLGDNVTLSTSGRRLPSEELASGKNYPEDRVAANKQAEREGYLDNLSEALQYLDLSKLGKAPQYKFDPPGVYRPRGGSGSEALKRLGIASLMQ